MGPSCLTEYKVSLILLAWHMSARIHATQWFANFFHLPTPWQPISRNCALRISKMFVINIVCCYFKFICWRICLFPIIIQFFFSRAPKCPGSYPGGTRAPRWESLVYQDWVRFRGLLRLAFCAFHATYSFSTRACFSELLSKACLRVTRVFIELCNQVVSRSCWYSEVSSAVIWI